MTLWQIVIAIIVALIANEGSEVSPWAGRKLTHWAAHHKYLDPDRAGTRAEDWLSVIEQRAGKLSKLITGLSFAVAAIIGPRVLAVESDAWRPSRLTLEKFGNYEFRHDPTAWSDRIGAMEAAWNEIVAAVDAVAAPGNLGRPGRGSCRRRLRVLRRLTGDDRWDTVASNARLLNDPARRYRWSGNSVPMTLNPRVLGDRIPTPAVVAEYLAAAENLRRDVSRLAGELRG